MCVCIGVITSFIFHSKPAFFVAVGTIERLNVSSVFCCALIEGNLCTYETNVTNERAVYQTRFIRFLLRENYKQANK